MWPLPGNGHAWLLLETALLSGYSHHSIARNVSTRQQRQALVSCGKLELHLQGLWLVQSDSELRIPQSAHTISIDRCVRCEP